MRREFQTWAVGTVLCSLFTLVRLFMEGNIMAGKNNGGLKYGGVSENRQI